MGLRVLLYSKKVAASKGNNCYLVGVNDEVKDVMDVTGFNNFFEMYDTMEDFLKNH
jgi:anti-anti-sigma factor